MKKMIKVIKKSELDNQKLSQIITPIDNDLEKFDFSNMIVKKPWGHEYLMYQTPKASIWVLHLKKGCMTSMHCHINKKTSLLIFSGEAICSTLDKGINLKEGDGLILDKKVFHSTQAISDDGVILIEVESPTKKTDLLRLSDTYGREKKGYENQKHMVQELDESNKVNFLADELNIEKNLGAFKFSLEKSENDEILSENLKSNKGAIGIILEGSIINKRTGELFEIADMFSYNDMQNVDSYRCEKSLVLLKIFK